MAYSLPRMLCPSTARVSLTDRTTAQVSAEENARFVWLDPWHANRPELTARLVMRQKINFFPAMKEARPSPGSRSHSLT